MSFRFFIKIIIISTKQAKIIYPGKAAWSPRACRRHGGDLDPKLDCAEADLGRRRPTLPSGDEDIEFLGDGLSAPGLIDSAEGWGWLRGCWRLASARRK